MKRSTVIVISALAAAFLLSGVSCRPGRNTIRFTGTVLEVSDSLLTNAAADTFRLGKLRSGERVIKEFAVKNGADVPLIINDIDSDCGCITAVNETKPLMPGELAPITLSFDSGGYRGYILKRVKIATTLGSKPLTVFIEAEVE